MLRVADYFSASDTGRQRRANEDSYLARTPVFVVADGMGGAQAGEVASRAAVELFAAGLPDGQESAEQLLASRVREANERIHSLSREDLRRAGMGTTLTAAYVGGDEVAFAHVGDSRAYVLRDGALQRLTEDHSLVDELRRQGKLTEEEAEDHPQRSIITRALGPEPEVEVDTLTHRARAGDVYLLCSDGLTSMVREQRVRDIILEAPNLDLAGRRLIEAANAAGGRDNITVVLFRLEEVGAAPAGIPDETTIIGVPPPSAEDAAAPASAPEAGPASTAGPRRLVPRMPPAARQLRRRRRVPIWARVAIVVALLVVVIGVGGWIASQTVYFVGTNKGGQITVFRGVPYELPLGLHLYQQNFVSGVTVAELSPLERRRLLNNKLRSHDDARDLVRRLELGEISQQ
jgi:protein phosphatase